MTGRPSPGDFDSSRAPTIAECKPGRFLLDPCRRVTEATSYDRATDEVTVKLAGPYASTSRYLRSLLRPPFIEDDGENDDESGLRADRRWGG